MVIESDVYSDDRGLFLDSSTFRTALASICIASDFAKSSKCTNFQEPADPRRITWIEWVKNRT